MSKIKKLLNSKKKDDIEVDSNGTIKVPVDINDIISDLISMIGVLSVDIFDWKGNAIYSYYRWGKMENILEEKDLFDLVQYIKKRLKKIEQNDLKHMVIRSEELNILVYSSAKIVVIIHCDQRAKLPLVTVRARRATEQLSNLISVKN